MMQDLRLSKVTDLAIVHGKPLTQVDIVEEQRQLLIKAAQNRLHPIVDALHTALHITSSDDDPGGDGPGQVCIVDFTLFGANRTAVPLDGSEARKATRGGRKQFMLSGYVTPAAAGAAGAWLGPARCVVPVTATMSCSSPPRLAAARLLGR